MDRDLEELRPFPPLGPAVKVLMVWPRFPASYWSLGEVTEIVPERSIVPPLGLITVAALCPKQWAIRLVDLAFEDNDKRREVARGITLSATGMKVQDGDPCITIADLGEGQTPRKFPDTFLSLEKSNKLRIPFVQGKFNMGGTGVLEFCGHKNLQLILSRRSPRILNGNFAHPTDDEWGFTIVRREDPSGNRRSSSYTFLAPVGADEVQQKGEVLTFSSDSMPIFPDGANPYAREVESGSLIKLYEYQMPGHRSHVLRKSGLLARLEVLIPEPA